MRRNVKEQVETGGGNTRSEPVTENNTRSYTPVSSQHVNSSFYETAACNATKKY
jgi:hypothetical protein